MNEEEWEKEGTQMSRACSPRTNTQSGWNQHTHLRLFQSTGDGAWAFSAHSQHTLLSSGTRTYRQPLASTADGKVLVLSTLSLRCHGQSFIPGGWRETESCLHKHTQGTLVHRCCFRADGHLKDYLQATLMMDMVHLLWLIQVSKLNRTYPSKCNFFSTKYKVFKDFWICKS